MRLDCLATALLHDENGELYGIWAGVTREERQATANLPVEIRSQLLDQMARSKASEVLAPAEAVSL